MIKVSICMAVYNGEKFIKKQIESILHQLDFTDEIIISDDHSTDNTFNIIASFEDPRIKVFTNNNKSGPVNNFENAIRNASGEIIFLSDQDDVWLNHKIATHLALHKSYDLVTSNALVVNQNNEVIYKSFFKQRNSQPGLIHNLIRNRYIGCCMSFNKEIANLALPFPANIHMHDWWIGLVGELKGKTYFCEEPLMMYRRHGTNASATLVKKLPFMQQLTNRVNLICYLMILTFKTLVSKK